MSAIHFHYNAAQTYLVAMYCSISKGYSYTLDKFYNTSQSEDTFSKMYTDSFKCSVSKYILENSKFSVVQINNAPPIKHF